MNGMQVQIPDSVTLQLSARDVSIILQALQGHGPFKAVAPVLQVVEFQLLSQQVRDPIKPPPVDNAHVAPGCELFDEPTDSPDPQGAATESTVAHHPV